MISGSIYNLSKVLPEVLQKCLMNLCIGGDDLSAKKVVSASLEITNHPSGVPDQE
jgi:hypothetical protein